MNKFVFAAFICATLWACGETPGTGTDATANTPGSSNAGAAGDSTMPSNTTPVNGDSGQITVMSTDSSQLKSSSDSALKKSGILKKDSAN